MRNHFAIIPADLSSDSFSRSVSGYLPKSSRCRYWCWWQPSTTLFSPFVPSAERANRINCVRRFSGAETTTRQTQSQNTSTLFVSITDTLGREPSAQFHQSSPSVKTGYSLIGTSPRAVSIRKWSMLAQNISINRLADIERVRQYDFIREVSLVVPVPTRDFWQTRFLKRHVSQNIKPTLTITKYGFAPFAIIFFTISRIIFALTSINSNRVCPGSCGAPVHEAATKTNHTRWSSFNRHSTLWQR